jgi:hypothetical protein
MMTDIVTTAGPIGVTSVLPSHSQPVHGAVNADGPSSSR